MCFYRKMNIIEVEEYNALVSIDRLGRKYGGGNALEKLTEDIKKKLSNNKLLNLEGVFIPRK